MVTRVPPRRPPQQKEAAGGLDNNTTIMAAPASAAGAAPPAAAAAAGCCPSQPVPAFKPSSAHVGVEPSRQVVEDRLFGVAKLPRSGLTCGAGREPVRGA